MLKVSCGSLMIGNSLGKLVFMRSATILPVEILRRVPRIQRHDYSPPENNGAICVEMGVIIGSSVQSVSSILADLFAVGDRSSMQVQEMRVLLLKDYVSNLKESK
jgi:hypothetical protein